MPFRWGSRIADQGSYIDREPGFAWRVVTSAVRGCASFASTFIVPGGAPTFSLTLCDCYNPNLPGAQRLDLGAAGAAESGDSDPDFSQALLFLLADAEKPLWRAK